MVDISLPVTRPVTRWHVARWILVLCCLLMAAIMNWSLAGALTEQVDNCNTATGRLVDKAKSHLGMSSQCCSGAILLTDEHSFLMTEDGHSKICLE